MHTKKPRLEFLIILLFLTVLFIGSLFLIPSEKEVEMDYSDFIQNLTEGNVESIEIGSTIVYFDLKSEDETENITYYTVITETSTALTQRALDYNVPISGSDNSAVSKLGSILFSVLELGIFIYFFRKIMSIGGLGGMSNKAEKSLVKVSTGIRFSDVAGQDEAKESLQEVVEFLHNPGKYTKIGAKIPKGVLLVGSPGTGKTLLAKAVAGEANVPFFSTTGSEFDEMFVGLGAKRIRDLFKEASEKAPCIIFIDEIDAVGRNRNIRKDGAQTGSEQTLNQLLAEMDGFDSSKGIIIMAATNRPEVIDKALLRPGRFDRKIIVDKPDLKGRTAILKVHAKNVKLNETVNLEEIALATSGAVGADLANMVNEAAINAVKEGREMVSQTDLLSAVEQVLVGKEKKDRILSKKEREIVSYHEIGHALVSALQKNSEPVQKITIVPRTMGALGYVMHVPEEEKYLNSKEELLDMLTGLVAGRAAEEIVFGSVTTGASNDIEKATEIARSMVTQYGMSEKFGIAGFATAQNKYLDGSTTLNCSDKTAAEIDDEVVSILKERYQAALTMLRENRTLMDELASYLIEKETITGKEFMEIFHNSKEQILTNNI